MSLVRQIASWRLCLLFAVLWIASCSDSPDSTDNQIPLSVTEARAACTTAINTQRQYCDTQCERLGVSSADMSSCLSQCQQEQTEGQTQCEATADAFAQYCLTTACAAGTQSCFTETTAAFDTCLSGCSEGNDFCANRCLKERGYNESACGYSPATAVGGSPLLPVLPVGQPAVLSGVLDDAEMAVVDAADERARQHRQREVVLVISERGVDVTVTQVEHAFRFGVPLDSREFEEGDGRLEFYADIARKHTTLLVAETSLKWRNTEREQGRLTFELADFELAWAQSLGFDVKAHVLLWGNPPPLASGSGTPDWLREQFPRPDLGDAEQQALRALIREHIHALVERYRGRIDVWEVTNEMLNPITSWFVDRLGPSVVDDAFRWAREADPGVELVYNEWISDIFTGLGGPDAVAVRDRVQQLLEAGIQVDAVGQQGHFAPGLVNVGIDEGLDARTRVDDYALALDTLAEAGLPIHITEVTFAAPDDPELRAAQAEAVMRIWWGHPQVEEIIFWNFWNPLGPRSRLNLGVYDDDGNLTRHGEAILSLLNDRWRTRVQALSGSAGEVSFTGTLGKYVAQWESVDGTRYVSFEVPRGSGVYRVLVAH